MRVTIPLFASYINRRGHRKYIAFIGAARVVTIYENVREVGGATCVAMVSDANREAR